MLEISKDCKNIVTSFQKISLLRDELVVPLKFDRLTISFMASIFVCARLSSRIEHVFYKLKNKKQKNNGWAGHHNHNKIQCNYIC